MAEYKRKSTAKHSTSTNRTRAATAGKRRTSSKKKSPFQKWLNKNTSKLCIGITAFIAVVLISLIVMVTMTLSYDKVYDGIYLNGELISYKSKEELRDFIEEKYSKPISNITIEITSGQRIWSLDASDLNITFNIDAIVESIYSHGHDGNIIERLQEIYGLRTNNLHINIFEESDTNTPLVNYDKSIIDSLTAEILEQATTQVTQHQVIVSDDFQVAIVSGSNGYAYQADTVKNALLLAVNEFESFQLDLRTIATVTKPDALDIDATLERLNIAPIDASYVKVNAKELSIAPESYGLEVKRADLEAVASQLNDNQGTTFSVTATKLAPAIYAANMEMPTYPDILGEKTTRFGTSSSYANRNTNLRIATETLNGYILLPGEQFSFNTYVGDTTADKGYLPAAGYSNGKVKDTYGGGICQVSTTLYNAVIYSVNVDVNARSSHSSTVSYVPKGLDCMINYNTTDFKFTNNTKYPIMIEGIYDETGNLTYRILGINEYKDISYEFVSTQTSSVEPQVEYTKNPGEVQSGRAGGKWSVERITYQNGVEIKRDPFSKSSYKPMNKIVLESTATPEPTPTPTPPAVTAPVAG